MSGLQFDAVMPARRELSSDLTEQAGSPVRAAAEPPSLVVGHALDPAEVAADRVADQVIARLRSEPDTETAEGHAHEHAHEGPDVRRSNAAAPAGPDGAEAAVGFEGGALDVEATSRIERARSGGTALAPSVRRRLEPAFGATLGGVTIHSDGEAAQLSRMISARAFTTGTDIFFGAGEYRPDTPDGERVLAHELAHVQQSRGVQRSVHRKLAGTTSALTALGGARTSNRKRRVGGLFTNKALTNWDRVLSGLRSYETIESKLLAGGVNPSKVVLNKAKPSMLKALYGIRTDIGQWKQANDHDAAEDQAASAHKSAKDSGDFAEDDERTKAGRRQAIALLTPRVGKEIADLNSADGAGWLASLQLAPQKAVATGKSDAGAKNVVNELTYQTESGQFSGFFKQDVGFQAKPELHELDQGIRQTDPNYGARSIALYRIDGLLGADVTARAEYAVHLDAKGKAILGTVLESAKGKQAKGMSYAQTAEHAQAIGGDTVSLDDPKLQEGLNKLQILDVICGQLDRHMGNYFVQTNGAGSVTGVTGIDLDMAFGADMKSIKAGGATGEAYKGLPDLIDGPFARRILAVSADDIRAALTGLLGAPEIAATVTRLQSVQLALKKASDDGVLVESWDQSTTSSLASNDLSFNSNRTTYGDDASSAASVGLEGRVAQWLVAILRDGEFDGSRVRQSWWAGLRGEPKPTRDAFITMASAGPMGLGVITKPVAEYAYDHRLSEADSRTLSELACSALLDPSFIGKVAVAVQENAVPDGVLYPLMRDELLAKWPAVLKRLKTVTAGARRRGVRLSGS